MKRTVAALAAVALGAISLSIPTSVVTTEAFASKMNGKCCASSDGGRSYRYRLVMRRRAIPHTCSAYAASCIRESSNRPDRFQMCYAARAQCLRTGVHVGPYSGYHYARMERR
jgi:hypothetical protein